MPEKELLDSFNYRSFLVRMARSGKDSSKTHESMCGPYFMKLWLRTFFRFYLCLRTLLLAFRKKKHTERCVFLVRRLCITQFQTRFGTGIRTRREWAVRTEEKCPADTFCRRGNERSEAIGATAPGQNPLRRAKSPVNTAFSVLFYILYFRCYNPFSTQ